MSKMKYVSIGRTGVYASVLALGAMTFGDKNTWKIGGLDQLTTEKMVKHSIDVGVNLFDTADVYDEGESEKALGRALKAYRDQVLVATKVRAKTGPGINDVGLSRRHVLSSIRKSLERLDTGWVDFYQFHSWDSRVPLNESIEAMQQLVENGLVHYPGVSNFTAWQMATLQAICEERGYSRYETAQMNYTLLNRDIEHELIPFMDYSKMTLLVWSPLHGGVLSGKYRREAKPEQGTRAGNRGLFFPFFDEINGWRIVEAIREIATEQGATPAQVAISWLASKGHVVLIGAKTLLQLDENLGSLDVKLTKKQLDDLDGLTRPRVQYPNWMIQRQSSGRDFETVEPAWSQT